MSGEIDRRLNHLNKMLNSDALARKAHPEFVRNTPIKKGQARRKTVLRGSEIQANYPYAGALENGHSDQAPEGMTKPTTDYISNYIRDVGLKGV